MTKRAGWVVLAMMSVSALAWADSPVARKVPTFHAVALQGNYTVTITAQKPQAVTLDGPTEAVKVITTKVKAGTLEIKQPKGKWWKVGGEPKITVTIAAPLVDRLDVAGAAKVDASGLKGPRFQIEAAGASTVKLAGKVDQLVYEGDGATNLDADGLAVKKAKLDVAGAGKAAVNASDNLDVTASGACSITYRGTPKIKQELNGMCSLSQR